MFNDFYCAAARRSKEKLNFNSLQIEGGANEFSTKRIRKRECRKVIHHSSGILILTFLNMKISSSCLLNDDRKVHKITNLLYEVDLLISCCLKINCHATQAARFRVCRKRKVKMDFHMI